MSSLFQDFTDNLFKVNKTISQNANADPNDVLNTKKALTQTGDYQAPDFGITDIPDRGMIDGLKNFQQKNGLKVDGVMKPNGPTESKINETLSNQDENKSNNILPLTLQKNKKSGVLSQNNDVSSFCTGLAKSIKEEEGFVREYGTNVLNADYDIRVMEDAINTGKQDVINGIRSYVISLGRDIATIPWTNLGGIIAAGANAGVGGYDLIVKYENVNNMIFRDLPSLERAKTTAQGLLDKAQTKLSNYLIQQKEKC